MEVAVKGRAKRKHLTAQDCDELRQGADSLTQPCTCNQGRSNHDPNRGLYPRTPRKRWKSAAAPATGSPSGKQKAINDFYSVTKVISSSPNKPLPSTSTHPKEGSAFMEQEDEEEDDDDVSLLATQCEPVATEEDEIDDESLLAAEMLPERRPFGETCWSGAGSAPERELKEEDYLEGLTAEMFGDDGVFDERCSGHEEEEVEPLPDAHFGLLGSRRVMLQPQGCMDDLPEEVLRQILCLLPAADLYRNASLVCHRWKNIVQDATFVPFKKQYYRYMMKETETMREVFFILKNSNIKGPSPSEHSLRNLVVLMAQHKIGERVRPEEVLERVKKHRLFPQAEASIRLRIPDIQKFLQLGVEGPNPYAAMAAILLLSERVGDVQDLASLLAGCMSLTAVTEYLSHMAMMLLALERSNIHISNRLHYNIYYVLHLLENGPFSVSSGQTGSPQIQLTGEQQQILSHDVQHDHVVKIIAFAGTGKTTTLIKYAEQRPHLRFLYVAFNNSVACEARRRFPCNVDCKTVHSLAYNDVGRRYANNKKLTFNLKPFSINFVLPSGRGGFAKAKVVATVLNAFMASADPTIIPRHVPEDYVSHKGLRTFINLEEQMMFVQDATRIWNKMKDIKEKSKHAYYMTHDGYLKLWQLRNPKPCLSDRYDAIFIDEAQDCTPAIMDVLLSQRCGKILVGDPHQQIYTFKGAVNALDIANHTHIFYLTQSFRFGAEIAYVGATILRVCKGVQKILVGGKQKGGVCDETANKALEAMKTGVSHSPGEIGILSRCNLGVFKTAVQLTDANLHCRIHFIGGVHNIGLDKIMDIYNLMTSEGQKDKLKSIKDPLVRSFSKKEDGAFQAFMKYVDQTEDKELEAKVNIVKNYRTRLPELVARLHCCFESSFHKADFIVGTVHKAKGLEFDTVIVNDDFANVPTSGHNFCFVPDFSFSKISNDEWNLLYVAVTRARTSLVATKNIFRILSVAKEYFLKSQMPVSPEAGGGPIPCSIPNCPNCLTPGSAFIMSRQTKQCTDRATHSGPLCERCVWMRSGPVAFLMTDDVLSMAEIPRHLRPPIHYPFVLPSGASKVHADLGP
ncbi:F-box DNA helicase 1 [Kryptolebias marmoratus]|uniref:F-box DNA helicase 1 n=1 Tax=Kryptolebias marmoratus TaxID=37003 RepID=UPI0007F8D551|nr:F-box DNA helicase 1 [Kryptolebias marmoratus]